MARLFWNRRITQNLTLKAHSYTLKLETMPRSAFELFVSVLTFAFCVLRYNTSMPVHQHRGGKYGKIVLKHHPIENLIAALEPIEALLEVQTIMPGVITSVRGSRGPEKLTIKIQYIAPDGHIRLIARRNSTTQEIRLTSSNPEQTRMDITALLLK